MGEAATRQAVDAVWRIESARLIGGTAIPVSTAEARANAPIAHRRKRSLIANLAPLSSALAHHFDLSVNSASDTPFA